MYNLLLLILLTSVRKAACVVVVLCRMIPKSDEPAIQNRTTQVASATPIGASRWRLPEESRKV